MECLKSESIKIVYTIYQRTTAKYADGGFVLIRNAVLCVGNVAETAFVNAMVAK